MIHNFQKKLVKSMLQACLQQSWPQDKPIAKIVFPQILPSSLGNLATLWVMLPHQEIQHHLFSKPYRQFLFIESPYPMLLWITAIHTQEHGSRWLPCYLDLKDPKSQQITQTLAQMGYYRLLLFSTQEPQRCAQVMTATLSPDQCQMLSKWAKISQSLQPTARPIASRRLLTTEFDKIKSQGSVKLNFAHDALKQSVNCA
jgi:serine/threonine-protein kinase